MSIISDAGTPLLSDPGKILLSECIKKNINIVPIPGVSAITASMSVSGFSDVFILWFFTKKQRNRHNLNYIIQLQIFTCFFYSGNKN